ncbi:MAG TPA: hypothetical protein VKT80_00710 [Chloroflexota bacterium]|nr:hypothetical protein [Chloroflexota bacterium]
MIAERSFSLRVLDRVAANEERRRRRNRIRLIWPVAAILILGVTWSIALFDAVIALRVLIEVISLVCAIGGLEQRLGSALLGPFAPLPMIASSLLFLAALGWVRSHQPDPPDRADD